MPGFNQKGPTGQGPMTGRKMGKCTNFGAGKRDLQKRQNTKILMLIKNKAWAEAED